jgi:hypothetical protein
MRSLRTSHLLVQAPLACPYLGRHLLEDACQLPERVVPAGDAVQLAAFEGFRLHGCRRCDDVVDLLQIFLLEVVQAFPGEPALILAEGAPGRTASVGSPRRPA